MISANRITGVKLFCWMPRQIQTVQLVNRHRQSTAIEACVRGGAPPKIRNSNKIAGCLYQRFSDITCPVLFLFGCCVIFRENYIKLFNDTAIFQALRSLPGHFLCGIITEANFKQAISRYKIGGIQSASLAANRAAFWALAKAPAWIVKPIISSDFAKAGGAVGSIRDALLWQAIISRGTNIKNIFIRQLFFITCSWTRPLSSDQYSAAGHYR